jgi:dTMP kinase
VTSAPTPPATDSATDSTIDPASDSVTDPVTDPASGPTTDSATGPASRREGRVPGGLFLSFEGIEGAGKSTQASRLAEWLVGRGHEVVPVREPGGTGLGEEIRAALLAPRQGGMASWCELCLYMASRAQLVREVVRPALARGAVVIADRFAESSVAYQGGGRGLGTRRVRALYEWVTEGLRPSPVFLLDLDPVCGIERITSARGSAMLDRLESEPMAFHRRIRSAYLQMARREPARFVVLDAAAGPDRVQTQVRGRLLALMSGATTETR